MLVLLDIKIKQKYVAAMLPGVWRPEAGWRGLETMRGLCLRACPTI
jgi:hypothetical protein